MSKGCAGLGDSWSLPWVALAWGSMNCGRGTGPGRTEGSITGGGVRGTSWLLTTMYIIGLDARGTGVAGMSGDISGVDILETGGR